MKTIPLITVLSLLTLIGNTAHAGLLEFRGGLKSCECAESCQPLSCKPSIARPCHAIIYAHQRKCSNVKPTSAATGCAAVCCCAPTSACDLAASCPPFAAYSVANCGDSCSGGQGGCPEDCREIVKLIQESMTGCYATHRRDAIHKLGDRYDCVCYPQIMNAFIYGLNDSDERVRSKSADEIGDQIRRNRCICGSPVIQALQRALADCDRGVRRQAEQALKLSGYEIVDGRCCTTTQSDPQIFKASVTAVWSGSTPKATSATAACEDVPALPPSSASEETSADDVEQDAADEKLKKDRLPELDPSPSDAGYDADPQSPDDMKATTAQPQTRFPSPRKTGVLSRLLRQRN